MTVKEMREDNPILAENGNIRDYTDLLHFVILSNFEKIKTELIEMGLLRKNKSLKKLQSIENKVNHYLLIEKTE